MNRNLVAFSALAIFAFALSCTQTSTREQGDSLIPNETIATIMARTSVHRYKAQPVEKEKVELLLRAAMAAPTAENRQPWHFVVVTDRTILSKIEQHPSPLAIVVCGDLNKSRGTGAEWWICDGSLASENIMLAAQSMGLSSVWTAVYPIESVMENVKSALRLPENLIPLNVIEIGYAEEKSQPRNKWNLDNVSYDTYGNGL